MSLTEVSGEKALAMRIPVRGSFGKIVPLENLGREMATDSIMTPDRAIIAQYI